jgi:hypothetical protein
MFNLAPGPGSYETAERAPIIPNTEDLNTDTLITLAELKNKLNTDSSLLKTSYL